MKILFVSYLYYPDVTGGAARSVQFLAESLATQGHSVHIARFTKTPQKPYVHNGVTVHCLTLRNIYWPYDGQKRSSWKRLLWHALDIFNPWAALDFYRLLRNLKPDLVNTSIIAGFSTSIFYVTRLLGIKTIHTMRDYYLMCPQVAMFKGNCNCEQICGSCKPFAKARSHALKNVDMVLGNSQFVIDRHQKHNILPKNVPAHVQWNMNLQPIAKTPRKFSKGNLRFGYIGKLSDTKGLEPLLEASLKLPAKGWSLLVAGAGDASYVESLKKRFAHPAITFGGWMDAPIFYSQIDVLLCPSVYHDPLPRVVLEAYAQGIPVIVSNTGGLPEMVDEGQTGYICNPKNLDDVIQCMSRFLHDSADYSAMSKATLKKAELFTQDRIVNQYLSRVKGLWDSQS